jgi:hypothetical protein
VLWIWDLLADFGSCPVVIRAIGGQPDPRRPQRQICIFARIWLYGTYLPKDAPLQASVLRGQEQDSKHKRAGDFTELLVCTAIPAPESQCAMPQPHRPLGVSPLAPSPPPRSAQNSRSNRLLLLSEAHVYRINYELCQVA